MIVTDSLTERFGAFIIIVLGETLTGVVADLSSQPVSGLTLAVGLVAVVVGFGAWWTYFDFAGGRRPRPERAASLRWVLGHLPLTAAIAAMGAAMLTLVDHAHDGRTPAATSWVLCAGAAVVLAATMLLAAGLPAWDRDRGLYRPLARTCAAAAVACLGLGAARPSPLILGLALVVLLSIPWGLAVARRLASPVGSPTQLPGPAGRALHDRERFYPGKWGQSLRDHEKVKIFLPNGAWFHSLRVVFDDAGEVDPGPDVQLVEDVTQVGVHRMG